MKLNKFYLLYLILPILILTVYSFELHIVKGVSMYPTFKEGDIIIVENVSPKINLLFRDQIIVVRDPRKKDHPLLIKRIIALPNETIKTSQEGIIISKSDGSILAYSSENYFGQNNGNTSSMNLGKYDYFLMGDNRTDSNDSRHWGPIQPHEMLGRVIFKFEKFW